MPRWPAAAICSALMLCATLCAPGEACAAPLKVVGRYLQDTHGNNILMRGVNVPVYKSGYLDDLDAVAGAIALTKANAVRLEWWAVPLGGQTEYSVAHFDRAIQKFYDLGIIPIVELHDLTFGTNRVAFANTITAFWTRPDIVAILVKHQDHIVVNLANEWGDAAAPADFLQNYTDAITAIRSAGIIAPLMVDAPKGFEAQFLLDNGHGAALLAADPQSNTMLSVHAYWGAGVAPPYYTDPQVNALLDALMNSGLPIVLGEASSRAYVNNPCDTINYANLLTRANTNAIGYLFWAWYEDGQCGQDMNITAGADGVTLPALAGFGHDALYAPGYGIDTALPATRKADFSPVVAGGANLSVSQSAAPNPGNTGKDVIYTLSISNAGLDTATAVTLTDTIPPGTSFIWASPGCVNAAGTVTCSLGTLVNGASATARVVVRPSSAGSKTNNVSVSAAEADPNMANNASASTIAVNASPVASQVQRYRLYSDVTKEHHFTTDLNEYNVLGSFVGTWVQEGPVGKVLNNPGSFGGVTAAPYYRLYDTATRWHHWTTDANEYYTLSMVYAGWNAEGVDGYILPTQAAGTIALYRLNYPALGSLHHWTIDANEYNTLITSYGWVGEGGSGFVIQ